jgi:ATP-dependent DNA ligase
MNEYNPDSYTGVGKLPTLYARAANDAVNQWTCWVNGPNVIVEWGQTGGTLQETSFLCEPKNTGRANATTAEDQAVKEAIAKWKKQVKKKYHTSVTAAQTSFNLKPMLAHEFKKRHDAGKVQFPVDVQPKFDGVRCLAYRKNGRVMLQSRGGDPYDVEHIRAALETVLPYQPDLVLDGELYTHEVSRQNIISLVKRPQPESIDLGYRVYDIAFLSEAPMPWHARRDFLAEWFEMHEDALSTHPIFEVASIEAHNAQQVKDLHDAYVKEGFEGAIIRQRQGMYRFAYRSHDLLKMKVFLEEDFEVIGWQRG